MASLSGYHVREGQPVGLLAPHNMSAAHEILNGWCVKRRNTCVDGKSAELDVVRVPSIQIDDENLLPVWR
ncbi:hypothetical protein SAMN05446635_6800 [Burkholderia sp. OK233]|nr:hypothetical protein SAMN05446635_6800 [Burkholderia sp. OK233]